MYQMEPPSEICSIFGWIKGASLEPRTIYWVNETSKSVTVFTHNFTATDVHAYTSCYLAQQC